MYHAKHSFSKKTREIHRKFTILFEKFTRSSPEIHNPFQEIHQKFTTRKHTNSPWSKRVKFTMHNPKVHQSRPNNCMEPFQTALDLLFSHVPQRTSIYAIPYGVPYCVPCGRPSGIPYGVSYGIPYGIPHGLPYSIPYGILS